MTRFIHRARSQRGISLLEIMSVLVIMGIVGGMATATMTNSRRAMQGDGAMRLLMGQLTLAREMAVTQRRNMEVKFLGNNWVQIIRQEVPAGTTTLASVVFEGNVQYALIPGIGDTPDGFGAGAGVAFGSTMTYTFTTEGTLVDDAGNPVNGTLFLSIANIKQSQRAVTVMGSTGRVRGYKWTGSSWDRV